MKKRLLLSHHVTSSIRKSFRVLGLFGFLSALSFSSQAQTMFGLAGSNLVTFNGLAPGAVTTVAPITGITAGQIIEGLDFRPATGQLYALGYNSATGATRLYTIDLTTAVATPIGTADITLATGMLELGMDFNPTVDRIRVVSDSRKNYRLHPNTGALVATDLDLVYNVTDINTGITPNVRAAAYTNSYIASTTTLLYDIDLATNSLVTQVPPNNGTLNTVGTLGISPSAPAHATDFDIFYNAGTVTNTGLLCAEVGGLNNFYVVDLATGAATILGILGQPVTDFSAQIIVNPPATIAGQLVYGLTSNGYLMSFDSGMPSTVRSHTSISGLVAGQTLVGMDSRPSTGQLYALGYNSTTGDAQLYTLNAATSTVTPIGAIAVLATGMTNISFDFNPTVDRIRVTSAQDNNYRLHPVTGAIVATDGVLAYNAADVNNAANPNIAAGAYTNSYIGGTATQLFGYDATLNVVTLQNPPNAGTLNTIGSSGITVNVADPSVDFDFFYNQTSGLNENYAVANTTNTFDDLYTVNTSTGAFTFLGQIGFGTAVIDMAVAINLNLPPVVAGQLVYGLTSNGYLISFDSGNPSVVRTHASLSGVTMGQTLVGLDSRPATGQLYALGYNTTTGDAQLYTLNAATSAVTPIGAIAVLATGMTNVSFDFNPTVDRIRVTSAQDNNYRLHPVTGAIVATDGVLAFAAADANNAANPNIAGGAYTNSFIGGTATQLFGYDATLNVVTLQNPPNAGTLNTIGASGITVNAADPSVDFDFFYNTATAMNENYMVANTANNFDNLYTVNTTTGAVTSVGLVGNGIAVIDMAVQIVPNIPAMVAGQIVYGVTSNNYLITFDSENPSVVRTHTSISGITAGQAIAGLDVRPATGELYALGYNSTNGDAQLYTINPSTGAATSIAAAVVLAPSLGNIGMDFNPTVDRIRVVSSSGANYRLHPTTGVIAGTDINLAYAVGDINEGSTPAIGSAAYTNSFGGSNNTKLYVYDDVMNMLALQNPPNNGTLNTIGMSGLVQSTIDATSDLDVYYNHNLHTNTAFMISNATTNDAFYTVNLTSGVATSVGTIGNGIAVRDIAVLNDSITTVSSTSAAISPTACETYTAADGAVYTTSGTYTAIIPNNAGYDSLITITLTINTQVTPAFTAVGPFCQNATGTSLSNISNDGFNGVWSPSAIVSTSTVGTSTYTFTPGSGQCATNSTLSVVINPLPAANAGADTTICVGQNVVIGSASVGGNTYSWGPATGLSSTTISNPSATPTATTTYTVTVTGGGCTNNDMITVAVDSCLSINELENDFFTVSPNPSEGVFVITVSSSTNSPIEVMDAAGRIIFTSTINSNQTTIDLTTVQSGVYFIKAGNTVKQVVKK